MALTTVERRSGQITAIQDEKGFGFVLGEDSTEYFFHVTEVVGGPEAFGGLEVGQWVTFQPLHTTKGWRAIKVETADMDGELP